MSESYDLRCPDCKDHPAHEWMISYCVCDPPSEDAMDVKSLTLCSLADGESFLDRIRAEGGYEEFMVLVRAMNNTVPFDLEELKRLHADLLRLGYAELK